MVLCELLANVRFAYMRIPTAFRLCNASGKMDAYE